MKTVVHHWTEEPAFKWVYRFAWLAIFGLIMAAYWWSPLSFALITGAMLTSTTLRVITLEVEVEIP